MDILGKPTWRCGDFPPIGIGKIKSRIKEEIIQGDVGEQ